jgi:hypothetical protein
VIVSVTPSDWAALVTCDWSTVTISHRLDRANGQRTSIVSPTDALAPAALTNSLGGTSLSSSIFWSTSVLVRVRPGVLHLDIKFILEVDQVTATVTYEGAVSCSRNLNAKHEAIAVSRAHPSTSSRDWVHRASGIRPLTPRQILGCTLMSQYQTGH